MKKTLKIVLFVLVAAWAVLVTVGSIALYDEMTDEQAELQKQYNELKAEYDALEEEGRDTLLRELAYKVMCDNLLDNEYDLDAELKQYAEKYDLDAFEEVKLASYVKTIAETYMIIAYNQ